MSSGAVEIINSMSQVRWERNSHIWQLGSHIQGTDPNIGDGLFDAHGHWKLDDRWAVELLKLYLMNLLANGTVDSVIDARIFLSLPPAW